MLNTDQQIKQQFNIECRACGSRDVKVDLYKEPSCNSPKELGLLRIKCSSCDNKINLEGTETNLLERLEEASKTPEDKATLWAITQEIYIKYGGAHADELLKSEIQKAGLIASKGHGKTFSNYASICGSAAKVQLRALEGSYGATDKEIKRLRNASKDKDRPH